MNIFVGNLNPETTAEALRILFAEFGEIMSSKVIFDNATGMSRGFGFVEMSSLGCSQDAIDNLDMSYFEGNIISVKEAKQSTNTRGSQKPAYGTSPGGRPFKPRIPRPGGNSGGYNNANSEGGYKSNFNRNY